MADKARCAVIKLVKYLAGMMDEGCMRKWLNIDEDIIFLGFCKELWWCIHCITFEFNLYFMNLRNVWKVGGIKALLVGLYFGVLWLCWEALKYLPGAYWGYGTIQVPIGRFLEALELPFRKYVHPVLWPMRHCYNIVNKIGKKVEGAPKEWADFDKEFTVACLALLSILKPALYDQLVDESEKPAVKAYLDGVNDRCKPEEPAQSSKSQS